MRALPPKEARHGDQDRIYFAQRAAEEQELAPSATDPDVAEAHRKLQRAYLERASVGDRPEGRSRADRLISLRALEAAVGFFEQRLRDCRARACSSRG